MVVGDLHGHIADLKSLLVRAGFDPQKDRVLSTGDLVDRGPDSMSCLHLLQNDWFYPVAGNHELMLTDRIRDLLAMGAASARDRRRALAAALRKEGNGGEWLIEAFLRRGDATYWESLLARLQDLPHVLVVGSGDERFHVLHGDLFLGQTLFSDADIDALSEDLGRGIFSKDVLADLVEQVSWNRSLAKQIEWGFAFEPLHEGLSLSFVGHNIVPEPRLALSHFHIDTGSGLQHLGRDRFGLTMVVLENGSPVQSLTTRTSSHTKERMIA